MIIPVFKARRLARTYMAERGDFDMSITHLHYLGIYKRRHAFEVDCDIPDGVVVDKGLPIVLIVTAKEVIYIQNGESLDIMYYFWKRKERNESYTIQT